MDLEFTPYVRRPYQVEVLEITKANIEEVANTIGELKNKDDGNPYIVIDRRVVPSITRAYPGFFLTRVNDNYRCFAGKVFKNLFIEHAPIISFSFMDPNMDPNERAELLRQALQESMEAELAEAIVEATEEVDQAPPHGIERPDVAVD